MVVRAWHEEPPEEIAQRDLRNDSGRILREVEAGKRFRVTVSGRPVADLIPTPRRRASLPGPEGAAFIRWARANADPDLWRDIRGDAPDYIPEDPWERYSEPPTT